MYDIRPSLDTWMAAGTPVALATVVRTWGSAPRPVGAKLAITDGAFAGSVSGGCVETAVIEAGRAVLAGGRPQRLAFGIADDDAWSVGLACGGEIEVWVHRLDAAVYRAVAAAMDREAAVSVGTVIDGPEDVTGGQVVLVDGLDEPPVVNGVPANLVPAIVGHLRGTPPADPPAGTRLFIDRIVPPPTLVVVGGVHIAVTLVRLARWVGFRTVVVDPREAFANPERFPDADRIIVDWPEAALASVPLTRSTAVAVLTHDPKLDDPALRAALASDAFYVGALGSPLTQARRRARLAAAGVGADRLDRLHGPIGLDIGARTPEAIALAVLAQVVRVRG